MSKIRLIKKYTYRRVKNKLSFWEKMMIVLLILVIMIFISMKYINDKVTPSLMEYAEIETKRFITIIINKAISESNVENLENLIIIEENNDIINTVDFNVILVTKTLSEITNKIEENIKLLESGNLKGIAGFEDDDLKNGIIYRIRGGLFGKNNIFYNYGPNIPIKIHTRGNITANIDTNLTNYGINNALVEISIKITLEEQIVLPLTTKTIIYENEIPLVIKMIEGTVPKYYSNGINGNSPIVSIPLEEN